MLKIAEFENERRWFRWCGASAAILAANMIGPGQAWAQQVAAPITVTPESLRPRVTGSDAAISLPDSAALLPPPGSESLSVTLDAIIVDGGFDELGAQTAGIISGLTHRAVTLAEIYAAASGIEAAHARAGYILARVSIPPQELEKDGTLRIVVTDGFIEQVDVSALPTRISAPVRHALVGLVGRAHLRMRDIERALVRAGDLPGLSLHSTLKRGERPGGTILLLDGDHREATGGVSFDNRLATSLGTYGVTGQLSLNSALGAGEQIYAFAASGYDLSRAFGTNTPVRVLGGGLAMPLAGNRLTLNPEATFSRTRPQPLADTPQTLGTLRRLTLRASYAAERLRRTRADASLTIEQIDAVNRLPDFGIDLSHDRYMALRIEGSFNHTDPSGARIGLEAQFSQGLGNLGGISPARSLAAGTPYSRDGAGNGFSHINLDLRYDRPLGKGFDLTARLGAQSSFGQALLRTEQYSLEGASALSAYAGGIATVDEGLTSRLEMGATLDAPPGSLHLRPYLFVAGGTGRLVRPSALEPSQITAANIGGGLVVRSGKGDATLTVEYAHGFSRLADLRSADRVGLSLSLFR